MATPSLDSDLRCDDSLAGPAPALTAQGASAPGLGDRSLSKQDLETEFAPACRALQPALCKDSLGSDSKIRMVIEHPMAPKELGLGHSSNLTGTRAHPRLNINLPSMASELCGPRQVATPL